MAWSWSHTNEAYEAARRNLGGLEMHTLAECAGQWHLLREAQEKDPDVQSYEVNYDRLAAERRRYAAMPRDVVEDYVWDQMAEAAVCTNGGWEAWVDPDGYVTVSFSDEEEIV